MKRIAAILCLAMFLTGCVGIVRLNNRGIVQAIGVDLAEDGSYLVTMQVFEAVGTAPAEANQSSGADNNVIVEESGKTLTEVFSKTAINQGKQMFLGNNKIIVIGERAAVSGVEQILNFFNANHQISPSVPIAVCRGEAREIMRAKEKNPLLTADYMIDIIHNAQKTGYCPQSRVMDLIDTMYCEHVSGLLAALAVEEKSEETEESSGASSQEESQEQQKGGSQEKQSSSVTIDLIGTGVFDGDRLTGMLGKNLTRGYCWTQNRIAATPLLIEYEGIGNVSSVTHEQKSKIIPELVGDNPVFTIEMKVKSIATETVLDSGFHMTDEQRELITTLQERLIQSEIEGALARSQQMGNDFFGLSLYMQQRFPEYYESNKDNWPQILASCGFQVHVKCEIDRSGVDNQII